MHKAILLDRDGTLNVDHGYVSKPTDFEWVQGVPQALKMLQNAGFLLIVVSNQSGISRGYYSEADLKELEQYMQADLMAQGVTISGYYYCPHVDADNCLCRKPKTLLVDSATSDFNINPSLSWMVGDRVRDLKSAEKQGFNLAGVLTGGGAEEFPGSQYKAFDSLLEFAEFVIGQ